MPYVQYDIRDYIDREIAALANKLKSEPAASKPDGSLNYAITRLICLGPNPQSYKDYNAVIGVLECVKLELYRRQIALYEDAVMDKNGDVYHRA